MTTELGYDSGSPTIKVSCLNGHKLLCIANLHTMVTTLDLIESSCMTPASLVRPRSLDQASNSMDSFSFSQKLAGTLRNYQTEDWTECI